MDRENTNAKLMLSVNEELKRHEAGRKPFLPVGERVRSEAIKMLGDTIRRPKNDPIRAVTMSDDELDLPEKNRIGRPRINWAILNMTMVWNKPEIIKE